MRFILVSHTEADFIFSPVASWSRSCPILSSVEMPLSYKKKKNLRRYTQNHALTSFSFCNIVPYSQGQLQVTVGTERASPGPVLPLEPGPPHKCTDLGKSLKLCTLVSTRVVVRIKGEATDRVPSLVPGTFPGFENVDVTAVDTDRPVEPRGQLSTLSPLLGNLAPSPRVGGKREP